MGDRHSNRRPKSKPAEQTQRPDVFAELGLSYADFDVDYGGGKSFLSGQRVIFMTVRNRTTGQTVSGKIGTTKRNQDQMADELLRILLRSFPRQ